MVRMTSGAPPAMTTPVVDGPAASICHASGRSLARRKREIGSWSRKNP
jgi:hypothetical protein